MRISDWSSDVCSSDLVDVYSTGVTPSQQIREEYWLPAATLTVEAAKDAQLRLSASKTIARPQFRELIAQPYVDIESNRFYRGNPFLKDSELWNADVRGEWYMGRDERRSEEHTSETPVTNSH